MPDSDATKNAGPRRWFRYRLSTLLAIMTLLGVWLGYSVPAARRQAQAVKTVSSVGLGSESQLAAPAVAYDFQFDASGLPVVGATSPWPEWLINRVGIDFFHTVVDVNWDGRSAGDGDLLTLAELPEVTRLDVERCSITDEGLAWIVEKLPNLVRLDLQDTKITDEGLRHVQKLKRLEILLLAEIEITDDGLANLRGLSRLQSLSLRFLGISGDGLRHLVDLPLKSLNLDYSKIQDGAVEHLSKMQRLEKLSIFETKLSTSAIEKLRTALPNCAITTRN